MYREVYQNWDGVVVTDALWTCAPANAADVVTVVNWAHQQGYTVRARGYRHTWSPLTVAPGTPADSKVILLDTTKHLTSMQISGTRKVRVQTGASMEDLLAYLSDQGYSVAATPAPGGITVGGALAINGHGTALPALGENRQAGQSFGTVSNLVLSLTAVVWDESQQRYVERTFDRSNSEAKAFLTHLGRALITEVTLQVMNDYNIRCLNYTDINSGELFAAPEAMTDRSLSKLLDAHGRVGLIWYAFTDRPWVQVWQPTPNKPLLSRLTLTPYNYLFADNLPSPVPQLLGNLIEGQDWVAPAFGNAILAATDAGLTALGARDMWGKSKNFLNWVKPTTLRVTAGAHVVITSRSNIQRVVHDFTTFYSAKLAEYQGRGEYPVNSALEIRITGVDTPSQVDVVGAEAPALSAARPVEGHPEWDVAVWLDLVTLPDTPHSNEFYSELENYFSRLPANQGLARPEWAKRFAHTAAGAWTDTAAMQGEIPASFPEWDWAVATLNKYDPHRLFSNPLINQLLS
nr:cholesterol oxidase substrate-binding domain-containing protein [Psychromicrobium silvestre]